MTEPTMREVQSKLPWALEYSKAFKHATVSHAVKPWTDGSDMAHLDFQHALVHVAKASGKLFAMCDNADHNRRESKVLPGREVGDGLGGDVIIYDRTDFPSADVEKLLADLVICAMRMANTRPGGAVDLWAATLRRIDEKNGSDLAGGAL